ncbi:hypothetical protein [Ensifer sp. Root231]|uniref:hypothetical protein n=2 Tax=Ensifer TaxID=106591 RepID=UPI001FCE074B|nr:hypothetical protein [Ensifer sp. Root231]
MVESLRPEVMLLDVQDDGLAIGHRRLVLNGRQQRGSVALTAPLRQNTDIDDEPTLLLRIKIDAAGWLASDLDNEKICVGKRRHVVAMLEQELLLEKGVFLFD